MNARAENCLGVMRELLKSAAAWEAANEHARAALRGNLACLALSAARDIDDIDEREAAAFERQFPTRYNTRGQALCKACFGLGSFDAQEGRARCPHCKGTGVQS